METAYLIDGARVYPEDTPGDWSDSLACRAGGGHAYAKAKRALPGGAMVLTDIEYEGLIT